MAEDAVEGPRTKTCYNCEQYKLCYVRHGMQDFVIKHSDMLRATNLPPIAKIMRCLAELCKEFSDDGEIMEGSGV